MFSELLCAGGVESPFLPVPIPITLTFSLWSVFFHMNWYLSVSIINLLICVYRYHFCSAQVSVCESLFSVLSSDSLPSNPFYLLSLSLCVCFLYSSLFFLLIMCRYFFNYPLFRIKICLISIYFWILLCSSYTLFKGEITEFLFCRLIG